MASPSRSRVRSSRRGLTWVVAATVGVLSAAGPVSAAPTQGTAPAPVTAEELTPLPVTDPAVTSGIAWHLDEIRARSAWRASLGYDVIVAVVDTGVDSDHPDLVGQVVDEISCIGADGDPQRCEGPAHDSSGHGTHVAALIAARTDDGVGVAGVAPRASLMSIKALNAECDAQECTARGDTADVAAGVRWALDNNADVINLSVTSSYRIEPVLSDAIAEAWDRGAIVVMAAGTSGSEPLRLDAREALVVTATDRAGVLAPYAPDVDTAALGLAAPGGRSGDTDETCHVGGRPVGIVSAFARHLGDQSGYTCLYGTSMAAAQVSGGLALLMSMGYPRDAALEQLFVTARPGTGLGGGQIDLAEAVSGELPLGVRYRHDPFENGVAAPVPDRAPTAGPFRVPEPTSSGGGIPVWLVMLVGAIAAAGLAEAAMRVFGRSGRHSEGRGPDRSEVAAVTPFSPATPESTAPPTPPDDGDRGRSAGSPYPAEPPYRDEP